MKRHHALLAAGTVHLFLAFASKVNGQEFQVKCQPSSCIYGDPSFCQFKNYPELEVIDIQSKSPSLLGQKGLFKKLTESDRVQLEFWDSDQYSGLTFRSEDFKEFLSGKDSHLSGTFEDGYTWADGYHVRAFMVASCTRK